MAKGYTTTDNIATQLGRSLTSVQEDYVEAAIIPAVESWIDDAGGRSYGDAAVVGEQLIFVGSPTVWLSKTPVTTVSEVRAWFWGETVDDEAVIDTTYYRLVNPANGQFYFPYYGSYEHIEIDYTPNAAIPDNIKLAATMVACVFMRTVLHPQTEWLTEYSSAQDLRLKFRTIEIPSIVYDLIGASHGGIVVA